MENMLPKIIFILKIINTQLKIKMVNTMEMILNNLTKNYGQKKALDDICLTLSPGIYGLLGPNGAGKSTMMNIITCNLKQSSGEVLFDGKDIRTLGSKFRQCIGYCPQQQAFYPGFTVEQFMFYMSSLHDMKKQIASERIDFVLKNLSLQDVRHKKIKSLSGGTKQRVLIAQSILHDPDILILDEPTAGLDPRQRIAVRNMIGKIALHKIVLISTHVVQDVEHIAKELIFLSDGHILCRGASSDLIKSIENRVWEVITDEEGLSRIQKCATVCEIADVKDGICVRFLSDKPLDEFCSPAEPTLEDVYLHYFGMAVEL